MQETPHGWWYNQLFTNWKKFEVTYISILLALQVIVYLIAPDSWIGMASGIFGTLCLVYGMKGAQDLLYFRLSSVLGDDVRCLDQPRLRVLCDGHFLCNFPADRVVHVGP